MKQFFLTYCLLTALLYQANAQDTLGIKYFDADFKITDATIARYYGFPQTISGKRGMAMLFNSDHVKVAAVNYSKDISYKEGMITGFFASGDTQFVCHYTKDNLNGVWQSWYLNGQPCDSGMLKNNMPDGTWKSWFPTGQLRMVAEFNAKRLGDLRDEMSRMYRPVFPLSATSTRNPMGVGGTSFNYQQTLYQQMQRAIHPPEIIGIASPGLSIKLRADYNTKNTTPNNISYAPPFNECAVHGLYKSYFSDGALKDSGYCYNGIRVGVWQEWDEKNDVRAIGFYKKGIRRDDWRYYSKEGKLVQVQRFDRWGRQKEQMNMNWGNAK